MGLNGMVLVPLPFAGENAKLPFNRAYEDEPGEEGGAHPLGGFRTSEWSDETIFDDSGP